MSGLLAKTVHQSPVVPSHRPGSVTGSRPSKSQSYMVVAMAAVASSLGTWRSRGTGAGSDGGGLDRQSSPGDGGVGRGGRRVRDVGRGERAQPASELEQDAIGILEVDAADVHALMHVVADAPLGVVVIGDLGAVDARGEEALAVLLDLLGCDV